MPTGRRRYPDGMANLSSSTIMLTGAGSALATAVAQELEDAGAQLVLVGRGEALAKAADRFPATEVFDLDLSDPASVEQLRTVDVDALVHTEGVFSPQSALDATSADYDRLFASNMQSLFHAIQGALPHMLEQEDGVIVALSAPRESRGEGAALYQASRAAMTSYVHSLHSELRSRGILGCVIHPMGPIDTLELREAGYEWEELIDPRGLAKTVAHALTRPARAHITELKVYPQK